MDDNRPTTNVVLQNAEGKFLQFRTQDTHTGTKIRTEWGPLNDADVIGPMQYMMYHREKWFRDILKQTVNTLPAKVTRIVELI